MLSSEFSAKPEEYFILKNGRPLKNLHELLNALNSLDDEIFSFHVNSEKNDFGEWIRHVFKDERLAHAVFSTTTKEGVINAIESSLFGHKQNAAKKATDNSGKKKLVRSFPFIRESAKSISRKANAKDVSELPAEKLNEILLKEKEIAKREEKIEDIEAKMEKELAALNEKKTQSFFSKDFIQGIAIGLLLALAIGISYLKFFA